MIDTMWEMKLGKGSGKYGTKEVGLEKDGHRSH